MEYRQTIELPPLGGNSMRQTTELEVKQTKELESILTPGTNPV